MKRSTRFVAKGSALVLSLAFITGCEMFKKKDAAKETANLSEADKVASAKVLCKIDEKAVIKESDFISNLTQMLQANPYFRGAGIDALPMTIKRKFFEELVKQEVIVAHETKNNLENDKEFNKALDEMVKLVKRSLMVQFFEKKIYEGLKVSDSEVSKHFDENKERYVKDPGGVVILGAKFTKDDQATAFLTEAKANLGNFEKLAKANKQSTFKDFGRVSKGMARGMPDSTPAPVKDSAFAMNKLPGIEKVKVGSEFWIIKASDKQEASYFQLSEIKPQVEAMLKNNLFRDALDKRLKDLKGEFKIVIDEEYFKDNMPAGGMSEDDDSSETAHNAGQPAGQATTAENAAKTPAAQPVAAAA